MGYFGLVASVFLEVLSDFDATSLGALAQIEADGLMSEAVWQAIKSNRWKKSLKWLQKATTKYTLPLAAVMLSIGAKIMGMLFESSRRWAS